jgi:hypothetical protein
MLAINYLCPAMKKYLITFLLFMVGICFSVSAIELNAFGIHNTFFDQYDAYVAAHDIDLSADVKVEKERKNNKSGLHPPRLFIKDFIYQKWLSKTFSSSSKVYTHKIFLRNSVWLI